MLETFAVQQLAEVSPTSIVPGPLDEFITDLITLDPVLVQLLVFSLLLGGIYGLVALGLTMIFGVMDVINFAHGAFLAVAMYIIWGAVHYLRVPLVISIPLAVIALGIIAVIAYQLTLSPIIEEPQYNQLIVTFGLLLILENSLNMTFSANFRDISPGFGVITIGPARVPIAQLIGFFLAIVSMLLVWLFLYRTRYGLAIRGTADNHDSARRVGININRVYQVTFALGAALAAIAGAAIAQYRHFDPYTGHLYLIYAFVIVVLGGLGSFPGAIVGGFIIGAVQVLGSFYMPNTSFNILIFGLFVLVLLIKPKGLFGEA